MSSGSGGSSDRRRHQLYGQDSVPSNTIDSIQRAEREQAERERAEREAQRAQALHKLEGGPEQSVGEPSYDTADEFQSSALSALEGRSVMPTTDAPKTQGPTGQTPPSENTRILSDGSGGTLGSNAETIIVQFHEPDEDKDDGGKGT